VRAGRVESGYGIPGGFLGGHPKGVDIEIERSRYDGRLLIRDLGHGVAQVEAVGSYKSYYHEEIESTGSCGVAFGLVTHDALVRARLKEGGLLGGAVFGGSFQNRDLATACLSFLPRTDEQSLGGFGYKKWQLDAGDLEGALRWDRRVITPAERDSNKAGSSTRRFSKAFPVPWPTAGTRAMPIASGASSPELTRRPRLKSSFPRDPIWLPIPTRWAMPTWRPNGAGGRNWKSRRDRTGCP
jgi:iron complex outermembrane receptor protein